MQTKIKATRLCLIAPALMLLASCSSDDNVDFTASKEAARAEAIEQLPVQALLDLSPADPADAKFPFPSNLLFAGSTDGTVNIPNPSSPPQVALNQQDGFSTSAPISTPVSEQLDPATLIVGETIHVFELAAPASPSPAVTVGSSVAELGPTQMAASQVGDQLALIPLVPLKPSTSYLIVLTNGIKDMQGDGMAPSFTYTLLTGNNELADPAQNGLRQAINSHSAFLAAATDVEPKDVALSWVVTTQSIRNVLQSVKDNTVASTLVVAAAGIATDNENIGGLGKADVYAGVLNLPYYLTLPEGTKDPSVLAGYWKNSDGNVLGAVGATGRNYTPEQTEIVTVPVLMTLPNATSTAGAVAPINGWPVTIFQHGILQNRTSMLAIADAMADAGRAVIAIDLPLHGIVDSNSALYAADNERTFNLDLVTVDPVTGFPVPGADEITDSPGTHFLNLANLANARDNMRQAVADLFVLTASLPTGISPDGNPLMLDASNLNFVGHSLGAIIGTTMLSYETSFQTATLAMPGGGIAQLLRNSPAFGPRIDATLAAGGVREGDADYQSFFIAAQTLLDSADPINHASTLAAAQTPLIHLIEMLNDQTIPNRVATAPLSGTEPLISQLGLEAVTETVSGRSGVVRFNTGDHGTLLRPAPVPADSTDTPDLAPTIEMQTQMATFAASPGATILITNAEVIAPAPTGAQ